jgi:hypothetical protein
VSGTEELRLDTILARRGGADHDEWVLCLHARLHKRRRAEVKTLVDVAELLGAPLLAAHAGRPGGQGGHRREPSPSPEPPMFSGPLLFDIS